MSRDGNGSSIKKLFLSFLSALSSLALPNVSREKSTFYRRGRRFPAGNVAELCKVFCLSRYYAVSRLGFLFLSSKSSYSFPETRGFGCSQEIYGA